MKRGAAFGFHRLTGRACIAGLLCSVGIALGALSFVPVRVFVAQEAPGAAARISDTLPADMPLTLTIVLKRTEPIGFERFLEGIENAASPSFRHYLSPRDQADRFGPSSASYEAIQAWLREQSFDVVDGSENRLTLTVHGTR